MRRADDGQVYVGSVQPGTPAEQSGLVAGESIMKALLAMLATALGLLAGK